jgi:hypothetical protein
LTETVLPFCSDEALLAELSVVVSAGWYLPAKPRRAQDVRHLLLLADPGHALSYRDAGQRLLVMLDEALQPDPEDDHPDTSDDDSTGLRILFGVHPTYRNEPSPTVRRREASDFLVPAWHVYPPRDDDTRASTFQRRHQPRALRQALECLRSKYGQAERPGIRDYDVITRRRWYQVAANRQVVRMRGEEIVRVREDNLASFSFSESTRDEEGLLAARFRVLDHALGPELTLDGITDAPTQPGVRDIRLRLPRPYMTGEVIGASWEETLTFGPDAPRWRRYFGAAEAPNDGAELEVTVTFDDDAELPALVWWYIALPGTNEFEIGPGPGERLTLDGGHSTSHRWAAIETERRISYGLQWYWSD